MPSAPDSASNATRVYTRAYLLTTCVVFALLTAAHLWRIVAETPALARDPWFVLITAASPTLSVWAGVVVRRTARARTTRE
ncbi:hypothetical protein tb265_48520 [Gemmatimonadetes bacterium T265]|nr:hypothetical protein tb265_45380 [Gemmatimonadetes bacterium T265]GJG89671.1 hypothetical protein tb265_48520 [Gemmatimonadetes bacterium T265]